MDYFVLGVIGVVFLLLFLAFGVHIGIALGFTGFAGVVIIYTQTVSFFDAFFMGLSLLLNTIFSTATDWVFVVLPLFIAMGFLASEAGIMDNAFSALVKWVGGIRGSLGIATVIGQTAFGLCTGSSIVACTVFAKVAAPDMLKYGYDKKFAYGLIAGSGSLGMIIPPSVLAIVYGLLSGESIGALFLGGVGPGILLSILFMISVSVMTFRDPTLAPLIKSDATTPEKIKSLLGLLPIAFVGFVVMFGIFNGIFTATEAGAVGALLVLGIGLANGKIKISKLLPPLMATASSTGMVFIIFIMAKIFSRFLNLSGIAPRLIQFVGELPVHPLVVVLGFIVVYLFLGTLLDSLSILIITVPLVVPIIHALHLDGIWFAWVAILAIECGLLTPPVGLNVYAVKGVAGDTVSLEDVFRGSFPFFLAMVICVAVLLFIPPIITWLPSLLTVTS